MKVKETKNSKNKKNKLTCLQVGKMEVACFLGYCVR